MNQTENNCLGNRLLDSSEELFPWKHGFSTFIIRQNSIKHDRAAFFQVSKETEQHIHSESVWPCARGREPYNRVEYKY